MPQHYTSQANESDEDDTAQTNPGGSSEPEVSSLDVQRDILSKVNSLMEVKGKVDSIESSMKFLAEKYDTLLAEVVGLRSENKEMKAELAALKAKKDTSREEIDNLQMQVVDLDQYGRRINLEIHGLTQGHGEPENLETALEGLAQKINVEYRPDSIQKAHRLQPRNDGKPPTVIVQFYSKTDRDSWLKNGRKAKLAGVYFNENLCPYYRLLLKDAKIRAKTHNYRFIWFSGGRVLARKEENSNVIVVKNRNDLNKIK